MSAQLSSSKKEFIETFFRRGAEFTEELLRENERLRYRVVELEEERRLISTEEKAGTSIGALRALAARIEALEGEREQLLGRFRGVEAQNQDFSSRYHEIERENNYLANLYVAAYQLHSSVDFRQVVRIIREILLNFVGTRVFAIQLVDESQARLRTLAAEGVERARVPEVGSTGGVIGEVIAGGRPFFDAARLGARADLERPIVVAPLRIRDQVVGVLIIWELLGHKTALQEVDYELFKLLGAHAALALESAWLRAGGGRASALWTAVDQV